LLINQYKILERLCPGEAEHYAQLRTALERGYALEYSDLFEDMNPSARWMSLIFSPKHVTG